MASSGRELLSNVVRMDVLMLVVVWWEGDASWADDDDDIMDSSAAVDDIFILFVVFAHCLLITSYMLWKTVIGNSSSSS